MEIVEEQVSKLEDQPEKFSWQAKYERKIKSHGTCSNTYLIETEDRSSVLAHNKEKTNINTKIN